MKSLILFTDAPAHGESYYDKKVFENYGIQLSDSFPSWDKKEKNLEYYFEQILKKNINFSAIPINELTDLMYKRLQDVSIQVNKKEFSLQKFSEF